MSNSALSTQSQKNSAFRILGLGLLTLSQLPFHAWSAAPGEDDAQTAAKMAACDGYLEKEITPLLAERIDDRKLERFVQVLKDPLIGERAIDTLLALGIYHRGEPTPLRPQGVLLSDPLKFHLFLYQSFFRGKISQTELRFADHSIHVYSKDNAPLMLSPGATSQRFHSVFQDLYERSVSYLEHTEPLMPTLSRIPGVLDPDGRLNLEELKKHPEAEKLYQELGQESAAIVKDTVPGIVAIVKYVTSLLNTIEAQKPILGWSWLSSDKKQFLREVFAMTQHMRAASLEDLDRILYLSFIARPSPLVPFDNDALIQNRMDQFRKQTDSVWGSTDREIQSRIEALRPILQ